MRGSPPVRIAEVIEQQMKQMCSAELRRAVNCSVHPLTYSWHSTKGFKNIEEGMNSQSSWRLEELD